MSVFGEELPQETPQPALLQERGLDEWIADRPEDMPSRHGARLGKHKRVRGVKVPLLRGARGKRDSSLRSKSEEPSTSHHGRTPDDRRMSLSPRRHLGAAPGSAALPSYFAPLVMGRGKLPKEEPPSTATWYIAKWEVQLNLPPFKPDTELELEQWFEDSSRKILAHGATAMIVVKVMQQSADAQMCYVLEAVLEEAKFFEFVEDLADSIALKRFRGTYVVEELEATLLLKRPQQTRWDYGRGRCDTGRANGNSSGLNSTNEGTVGTHRSEQTALTTRVLHTVVHEL